MSDVTAELDRLIERLEGASSTTAAAPAAAGDAIDAVLSSPPRATAVRSLRRDPVVETFRRELTDGLIRVDTLNRLLGLVNTVVTALLTR